MKNGGRKRVKAKRDFLAWTEQGMEVLVPEPDGQWGGGRSEMRAEGAAALTWICRV